MPACTKKRLVQTQVCPELRYLAMMEPSTARSISASSKTMNGALPPSSIDTFLTVEAAFWMSTLPTSVEPVKVIFWTSGLAQISSPISAAEPVTMLTTPLGKPTSSASAPQARPEYGVCEAGLTTAVQPAASAGPIFRASMDDGKFHGVIAAMTPTGCLMVMMRRSAHGDGTTSP